MSPAITHLLNVVAFQAQAWRRVRQSVPRSPMEPAPDGLVALYASQGEVVIDTGWTHDHRHLRALLAAEMDAHIARCLLHEASWLSAQGLRPVVVEYRGSITDEHGPAVAVRVDGYNGLRLTRPSGMVLRHVRAASIGPITENDARLLGLAHGEYEVKDRFAPALWQKLPATQTHRTYAHV